MSKYSAENVPGKATATDRVSWYKTLIELASKGVSNKSIAARLGISLDNFYALVEYEEKGRKPVKEALDLARAEFEIIRVEAKDAIFNDEKTSQGLKYKIIREDLKTLEEWAPATKAVKVTIENAPTEFSFESFTNDELAQIASNSADADTPSTDGEIKAENTED